MGLTRPASGSITYNGVQLMGKPPVLDRQAGHRLRARRSRHLRRPHRARKPRGGRDPPARGGNGEAWTLERVYAAFPSLQGLRARRGEHLSGGEQRLLSVARALLTHPRLLIFDEPAECLSPLVVRAVRDWIRRLKQGGISILLSEQNVRFALEVSDRAYVIDKGVIRHQGSVEELRANEEVRKRYLMV